MDSRSHVPALDGMRGLAILLVIVYHFARSLNALGVEIPGRRMLQFGWSGVDVFFALSGFLITGILLDTKSSPGYFRNFYAKRVLRIFPLYYGSLVVVFLLSTMLASAGIWGAQDGAVAPASLFWPALFLENVTIFLAGASVTGVTTHYWSLAVEEHFYLLWPLVVWLATKRQVLVVALLAAGASIAARAVCYLRGADLDLVFGLSPFRMDGLAIGALAAVVIRGSGGVAAVARPALLVLGVAATFLAALLLLRNTASQSDPLIWVFAYPLVAICTVTALVGGLAGGHLARFLSFGLFRWFGKYSYGLYVWHPIIGMLLLHSQVSLVPAGAGKGLVLVLAALTLGIDLLVAWLSFHLWEKRFLDLKRYFTNDTPRSRAVVVAGATGKEQEELAA